MAEIFGYVDTDQAIRNVSMMRTKKMPSKRRVLMKALKIKDKLGIQYISMKRASLFIVGI